MPWREDGPGYRQAGRPCRGRRREQHMDDEARRSMALIGEATDRLLASAAALTGARVREPSLLPGWTRGHVLTHVARNGDGLGNLLRWARPGTRTPMYASREARRSDIEAGAGLCAADLAADVQARPTVGKASRRAKPSSCTSAARSAAVLACAPASMSDRRASRLAYMGVLVPGTRPAQQIAQAVPVAGDVGQHVPAGPAGQQRRLTDAGAGQRGGGSEQAVRRLPDEGPLTGESSSSMCCSLGLPPAGRPACR